MRPRPIDVADLLAAASAATGTPIDELLPSTDLPLLCLIAERTRDHIAPVDAVTEMLVGVAAGQPFPARNSAAAWALAAFVADGRRHRLRATPVQARQLVREARVGVDETDLVPRVAARLGRRRPVIEAIERWWTVPPRPGPVVWACPVCGRGVRVPPCRSSIMLVDPLAHDVVTDCARRTGEHDRGVVGRDYGPLTVCRPAPAMSSPI